MSRVNDSSSSRDFNVLRCVGLCWLSTLQDLRSDTRGSTRWTCSTHFRRREGLRNFPRPLLSRSTCLEQARQWFVLAGRSLARVSSGALPGRGSVHRTRVATGNKCVGDTDLTYCLIDALAARNCNFNLPKLVQDLLRTMSFSWHFCFPSKRPVSDLSAGHV
jgi:hypothetical protein